ncbi:MAG: hypothetical protein NVS4B2_34820 [Chloroflexota bacterium]
MALGITVRTEELKPTGLGEAEETMDWDASSQKYADLLSVGCRRRCSLYSVRLWVQSAPLCGRST